MAKPTKGSEATKSTTKTAAQLRKEEQDKKTAAAASTSGATNKEALKERQIEERTPTTVKNTPKTTASSGNGGGDVSYPKEYYPPMAGTDAEDYDYDSHTTKKEAFKERQLAAYEPTGTTTKHGTLTAADETPRRKTGAEVRAERESVYNPTGAKRLTTNKDRFKESQIEAQADKYVPRAKRWGELSGLEYDETGRMTPESRKEYYERTQDARKSVGNRRYNLPTANSRLEGDWLDKMKKGELTEQDMWGQLAKASVSNEDIFVIDGRPVTISDLRRQGYSETLINNLLALTQRKTVKDYSGSPASNASILANNMGAMLQNAQDYMAGHPDEVTTYYLNVYSEQMDNYDKLLQDGSLTKKEREQYRDEREKAYANYLNTLLYASDDKYIDFALEQAQKERDELQSVYMAVYAYGDEETLEKLKGAQDTINGLTNRIAKLQQIKNARETAAVVDKVESNGDGALMRELADAYQANIGSKSAAMAAALTGGDSYIPAQAETRSRYMQLEADAKQKGYTDADIAAYAQYLYTKDYDKTFGPYLKWIQEHPVAGPVVAGAVQVLSSPVRGMTRLLTGAASAETPNAADPGKMLTDAVKQGTEAAVQGIVDFYSDKDGKPTWYGKSIAKVYQWSASAVESAALMATTGGAASVIMGMNAAADSYDEALARGLPAKQAAALGVTSGVFEALFEWLSLDKIKWFNNTKLTGKKAWATMLAKSMFVEGSEEVNTDLANLMADFLIAGGLSEYNTAMAEGKTPGEFALEKGWELLDSFLGGAFSGGLMGATSQVTQHGFSSIVQHGVDKSAGRAVDQYGDVTELLDQARNSGDETLEKLSKKIEQRMLDGKSATYQTGKLYNLLQEKDIRAAAKQAALDKGASEKQADAIADGIADAFNRQPVDPGSATALESEIGRRVAQEFDEKSAAWSKELAGKYRERQVVSGVATDRAARAVRNNSRIDESRAEINEAMRGGKSYALIENGFEGRMGGENGAAVKLGGVVELNGDDKLVVAVDYDAKDGTHAEMVYDPAGAAGTVRSTDVTAEEMYGYAVEFMSGMAGQDAQIGTLYPNDGGMKMSAAAANDMIYVYEPAVNPDTAGYCYFFNDAYKAGRSGVSWGGYLDVVGRDSKAEWADILTETQLREAFRAGQMEFSPAKGVTRIGTARLSDKALNRLAVLDGIMKKLGFSVIAVDTIEDKNGYVSDRADVAVINLLGADRGLFEVAAFHEVLHVVTRELGVRSGRQFVDAVLGVYRETVSAERYDSDYAKAKRRYGEDLAGLDEEAADRLIKEELAAQYFAGVATNHMDRFVARLEQGGHELLTKVREALQAFADELKKALNRLAGLDPATAAALRTEAAQAERIFDLFEEAVKQAEEVREQRLAEQGGTLKEQAERGELEDKSEKNVLSIKVDENGRYVSIDVDQKLFDGKSTKEMRTIARHIIKDNFGGKILPVGESGKAYIPNRAGKEYVYPAKHNVEEDLLRAKYKTATELDNLLKVSDFIQNVPDDGRHPEATGGWDNYRTRFSIGGVFFEGTVKIMVTDRGYKFHDITGIKVDVTHSSDLSEKTSDVAMDNVQNYDTTKITQSQAANAGTSNSYKFANDSENGRDRAYLAALQRGDMDEAQRMVDEAAKAAGYDTQKLYHGTPNFGFTKFKTTNISELDLHVPKNYIFTTTSLDVAKTYTTENGVPRDTAPGIKHIGEQVQNKINVDTLDGIDLLNAAKRIAEERYHGYTLLTEGDKKRYRQNARETIEKTAHGFKSDFLDKRVFQDDEIEYVIELIETIAKIQNVKTFNEATEAYSAFIDKESSLYYLLPGVTLSDEDVDEYFDEDTIDRFRAYMDEIKDSFGILVDAFYPGSLYHNGTGFVYDNALKSEINKELHRGVYQLYGRMGKSLTVDAQGALWKRIKAPDELHILKPTTTNKIALEAFRLGYDSVKIVNVLDNGMATDYRGTGDVYIFNAKNAVKSADPVTYDDNGNVIPLSERFNEKKADIRYSRKVDFSYKELTQSPDLQGNIVSQAVKTNNGVVDVKWLVGEIQKQCNSVYVGKSTTPTYYLPCDDLEGNIEISSSGLVHGLIKSQTGKISPSEQVHAKILLDMKNVLKNAIEVNRSNRPNGFDSVGQSILLGVSSLTDGKTADMYAVKFVVDHRKNQAPVLVEMNVLSKLYSANTKKIDPAMLRQKGIALTNSGRFNISVADLIDLVKEDYDDIFSNDVYSHFGMQRAVTKDTPYLQFSRKAEDARGKFDAAAAGGEMLGQMLDETLKLLHKAHNELDKAQYDAWLQGETTEGRVKTRKGVLGVVKKYNDEKLTGVSNEDFTDRIMQAFMDLKDYDYGAEELVNAVLDVMADKAAAQVQTVENETRDIIRGITDGAKYVVSDGAFKELTETLGGRRAMNDVFRTVYGFTLVPENEAARRGASVAFDAGMQEVTEALPGLFANSSATLFGYDADNGSVVNMATALFEMQDAMQVQERTMAQELGLDKLAPNSDEALAATMTLYERAYQDAIDMAEDLIRLTPARTLADTYAGRLEELRQAAKGQLQARQKEIAALMDRIETAEVGVGMAAQVNRTLTEEAAKMERKIGELENELADARYALRQAEETGRGQETALAEKVSGLEEQIKGLKKDLRIEKGKATRQKNLTEKQKQANKEYFTDLRHKMLERQRDTRERAKVLRSIETRVKWFNDRLTNPSKDKHIPLALQETIRPIIDYFLFNSNIYTDAQITKLADWYSRLDDRHEAKNLDDSSIQYFGLYNTEMEEKVNEFKDNVRKREKNEAELTEKEIKQLAGGKKEDRLSLEELKNVRDIIKAMQHLVIEADSMFVQGKRVNYTEAGTRMWQYAQDQSKDGRVAEFKIKVMNGLLGVEMLKPIYLFNEVIGGEMRQYFDDIREAQNRYAFRLRDAEQALLALDKQYHRKQWFRETETFTLDSGDRLTLDKDAVMQLYATRRREMQSVTETNHLLGGGIELSDELLELQKKTDREQWENLKKKTDLKLTLEDLTRIMATLTDEQKDFADAVVKFMSTTCSAWGNEVSRELAGFDNFTEPYYFPYAVSGNYLYQKVGQQQDIRLKNTGFTHALKPKAAKTIALTGFMDIAGKHIGAMVSYSTLTIPLENLQRVRNFTPEGEKASVHKVIQNTYGGGVAHYIQNFLNDANGNVRRTDSAGFLSKTMGIFKRSAVALNASVVIQQPSAIARAMAMVDPIYFVRATCNWGDYKELMKYSGVAIIKELGGWDINTGRSTIDFLTHNDGRTRWERFNNRADQATGYLAGKADAITWSHIWNAVKRETAHEMDVKYQRKGMSEEFYRRAAARFNEVADYTQVYDSTISRSQIMRNQNDLVKMATAFMAEPTTSYNLLVFSGMKKNGKTINKGAALGAFICNVVFNTALQSLVGAWRDKKDESYWERWFRHFIEGIFGTRENLFTDSEFNIFNMIPAIKDVISLMQGYDVERSDMQPINEMWKPIKKLIDAYKDREDDEALFDFMKANSELLLSFGVTLTNFTHIPLKSLYRDVWQGGKNAFEHMMDGDFHTTAQHIANIWKQNFEGEWDKNEQLYYAVLQGDKELLDRYTKVTPEDYEKYINSKTSELDAIAYATNKKTNDMHERIAKALAAMDERIEKAAWLVYSGDVDKARTLADAVAEDGFSISDVYKAIQLTGKELFSNDEEYSNKIKSYDLVTYDMLDNAYYDDNTYGVRELRDALIEQGKTADTVNKHIAEMIDEDFATGEISLTEAKKNYGELTTYSDKKITDRLTKQAAELYANDGDLSYDALRDVYLQIGVAEEDVGKQMADVVVSDYVAGKFAGKDAAVAEYMKQTGETDEKAAALKFDYEDAKARDENYPLTFSNYKKYVESGLEKTGVSVAAYDQFLTATKDIDSKTTSVGWEAYSARMANVKSYNKFTAKQWHFVQAIEENFDTVEQKDAAYKATAAAENWSLAKLPLTPWH